MKLKTIFLFPGILSAWVVLPVAALEVYQWTDENGVVHFSQWAPQESIEDVETVSVPGGEEAENGLGISEKDDPEGYRAHRAQMDALWADMEAQRAAERERQELATHTEYIYQQTENNSPYLFPGYGYRPPNRPPHRPPNRPRPRPLPGDLDDTGSPVVAPATFKRP